MLSLPELEARRAEAAVVAPKGEARRRLSWPASKEGAERLAAEGWLVGPEPGWQTRDFRPEDAAAVFALPQALTPDEAVSPAGLLHRVESMPARVRARFWVAEEAGEIVGFARAYFRWAGAVEGAARLYAAVRPEARGHGLGSALFEDAERHLLAHGARRLVSRIPETDEGIRFVERRGFRPGRPEIVSVLDVHAADLSRLPVLAAERAAEGFRLASLRELAGQERDLYELYTAAEAGSPADERASTSATRSCARRSSTPISTGTGASSSSPVRGPSRSPSCLQAASAGWPPTS